MTAKEAYDIIKREEPGRVVVECLEFADFYAFATREKGTEHEPAGGGYATVNKTNGEISGFTPTEDLDAFFAAKKIDVSTMY